MSLDEIASDHPIDETTEIVAAYVSNNRVSEADLPTLISSVYAALCNIKSSTLAAPEPKPLVPAVPIKKSIFDDHLICLEDGKKFKSLKRHLMAHYDLTPEAYRAKWGLPMDYPMVAPNYAAARSVMAKNMGLGRKPGVTGPGNAAMSAKIRRARKAKETA